MNGSIGNQTCNSYNEMENKLKVSLLKGYKKYYLVGDVMTL